MVEPSAEHCQHVNALPTRQKIQLSASCSPETVALVEQYRRRQGLRSSAEAVRQLLERALSASPA